MVCLSFWVWILLLLVQFIIYNSYLILHVSLFASQCNRNDRNKTNVHRNTCTISGSSCAIIFGVSLNRLLFFLALQWKRIVEVYPSARLAFCCCSNCTQHAKMGQWVHNSLCTSLLLLDLLAFRPTMEDTAKTIPRKYVRRACSMFE